MITSASVFIRQREVNRARARSTFNRYIIDIPEFFYSDRVHRKVKRKFSIFFLMESRATQNRRLMKDCSIKWKRVPSALAVIKKFIVIMTASCT